jgi:hypothetical protein
MVCVDGKIVDSMLAQPLPVPEHRLLNRRRPGLVHSDVDKNSRFHLAFVLGACMGRSRGSMTTKIHHRKRCDRLIA